MLDDNQAPSTNIQLLKLFRTTKEESAINSQGFDKTMNNPNEQMIRSLCSRYDVNPEELAEHMKSFSSNDFVQSECEAKRHLPLAQCRDKEGEPWVNYICMACGKPAETPTEFLKCSRCKAALYCSRDCQKMDWRGQANGGPAPGRSHKSWCPEFAAVRLEFQENERCGEKIRRDLFSSWADQHHKKDGSFFTAEFLARRGLLGKAAYDSFWAQPESRTPYMPNGLDIKGFQNGAMLLKPKFPSHKKGWKKLQDDEFPSLEPPGTSPPTAGIDSWEAYLKYRNISPTSISPHLLTNVLTVYQMLHHSLKVTRRDTNSGPRKEVIVHLVGPEIELNHIPLFGELAYLLPGIDLKLIWTSPATKEIYDKARELKNRNGKKSILSEAVDGIVLDVEAPATIGHGRVRVQLDGRNDTFPSNSFDDHRPDAIIGLNAGLASYPTWRPVVLFAVQSDTPFCFSDTTFVSQRHAELLWLPYIGLYGGLPVEIKLNPFHGVVNRDQAAVLIPNINNGYLLYECSDRNGNYR